MSDTIFESLKNAQTLQEVAILLNEATPHTGGGLTKNSTAQEYVNALITARALLMSQFQWRLYGDTTAIHFNKAHISMLMVANAIEEQGVLR